MSIERGITAFAGFMVLLSLVLFLKVHPAFIWLTAFVGFNLLQSTFTGFCPAAIVMRKMGMQVGYTTARQQFVNQVPGLK